RAIRIDQLRPDELWRCFDPTGELHCEIGHAVAGSKSRAAGPTRPERASPGAATRRSLSMVVKCARRGFTTAPRGGWRSRNADQFVRLKTEAPTRVGAAVVDRPLRIGA